MKLKTQIFIAFFLMIFVPVTLFALVAIGVACTDPERVKLVYGIDLSNLSRQAVALGTDIIFAVLVVLAVTGLLISLWLYSSIAGPVKSLTQSANEIAQGNMDYQVRPRGSLEMRELCESFEGMRIKLFEAGEDKVEYDEENRRLIANIGHDLKTPMTAIKGYVEGIIDGVADTPEKLDHYIRTIHRKTDELDRLINELTFYTNIKSDRIPYNFRKIGAKDYFDDAASEIKEEMEDKGISFSYSNTASKWTRVVIDMEQVRRALNNVIDNAVKYMDKKEKKIEFRVSEEGDWVKAEVIDNGRGIREEDLGLIFDRFYRTDESRSSETGGSGLGLSIVSKIVEDHDGRVGASSVFGEGTDIWFMIKKSLGGSTDEEQA